MRALVSIVAILAFVNADADITANKEIRVGDHGLEIPDYIQNAFKSSQLGYLKDGEIVAIINEYVDKILVNIDNIIVHAGYDPFQLPDVTKEISVKFIITYWGQFNMTQGWLQDVSSIHRDGDAVITYDDKKQVKVTLPLTFNVLQLYYNYAVKIMGLGPTGGIDGKVTDIKMKIVVRVDWENYTISLENYDIISSGHIELDFNGNSLIDWLLDLLTNTATMALKPIILGVVEIIVKGTLDAVFNLINEVIYDILHPSTAASTDSTNPIAEIFQRPIIN